MSFFKNKRTETILEENELENYKPNFNWRHTTSWNNSNEKGLNNYGFGDVNVSDDFNFVEF